jgi:hypothetical protein
LSALSELLTQTALPNTGDWILGEKPEEQTDALVAMYSLTNLFNNVFAPEMDFRAVTPAGSRLDHSLTSVQGR